MNPHLRPDDRRKWSQATGTSVRLSVSPAVYDPCRPAFGRRTRARGHRTSIATRF